MLKFLIIGQFAPLLALACLQAELIMIHNTGNITDYATKTDEIEIYFGVGNIFVYESNQVTFTVNQAYTFQSGALTFPCFEDEPLWVRFEEIDSVTNEDTFVMLDCKKLQVGQNAIDIEISEDSNIVSTTADFLDDQIGFSFGFKAKAGSGAQPGTYQIIFDVTEECTAYNFDEEAVAESIRFKRLTGRNITAEQI